MPWPVMPLKDRERRLREGIASRLGFASAPSRASNMGALTAETAAEVDDVHAHVAHQARQINAATADAESLEALHGRPLGLPRLQPAAATGAVTFAGVDGAIVPAGTVLRHADGRTYATASAVVIADGTAEAEIVAEQKGAAGNLDPGESLALTGSVAGVEDTATLSIAATGGTDLEGVEAYRARVLFRKAHPPGAGHEADYVVWTMQVGGGITDVWVTNRAQGHGTVTIRFATYDAPDGPIPSEALCLAVAEWIEGHVNEVTGQWEGRPAGMEVFVVRLTGKVLDLDFAELAPDTPEVRAAIAASMAEMLKRRARPGGTIRMDWINEAISRATGEDRHRLASPAADVPCGANELAVMGAITVGGA